MAKAKLVSSPAPFEHAASVVVTEEGIRPWAGVVQTVKWSSESGWWAEVHRGGTAETYVIRAADVRVLEGGS